MDVSHLNDSGLLQRLCDTNRLSRILIALRFSEIMVDKARLHSSAGASLTYCGAVTEINYGTLSSSEMSYLAVKNTLCGSEIWWLKQFETLISNRERSSRRLSQETSAKVGLDKMARKAEHWWILLATYCFYFSISNAEGKVFSHHSDFRKKMIKFNFTGHRTGFSFG